MNRKQLDDDDREDEKGDDRSLDHVSADSKRDDSKRESFQDAFLATRVDLHRKYIIARATHPLRPYVFLVVLPGQELEISRGEHVDDDGGFGKEHNDRRDDVERSGRSHGAGGRAVQYARRLSLSEWTRGLRL